MKPAEMYLQNPRWHNANQPLLGAAVIARHYHPTL
jgi:hypothetical protein